MFLKKLSFGFCFLLLLVFFNNSFAGTYTVAKWGADSASCGGSSAPCLTIQQAVDNAGSNSKIIVQPGLYQENVNIITDGLQMESTGGRYSTIIQASDTSDHVLEINASKISIGKKGKGFTFKGSNTT